MTSNVDRAYCMSSYLMYRSVVDPTKMFAPGRLPRTAGGVWGRVPVACAEELERHLQNEVEKAAQGGKAALALSGGIDSAILARFMPRGSTAYTFRCIVPGKRVTDESRGAAWYVQMCGLKHRIIDIRWEDFEACAPVLMEHKNAPIHSIEVQIYKAGQQAKAAGFDKLIFGETADINYGGLDSLLSQEWKLGDFVERYAYVKPWAALYNPDLDLKPIYKWEKQKSGYIDTYGFVNDIFKREALSTYTNACECAGITFCAPYATSYMDTELDYGKIRGGESKYFVREVFQKLYPDAHIPPKIPMPRPMNEWMANWQGPVRAEFIPHCADGLTGDQKWMLWSLEKFLNMLEEDRK